VKGVISGSLWPIPLRRLALGALLLAALLTYGHFSSRYAGGCDTWAYLSDSLVLRGKDVGLNGSLDPAKFPALVPLCYERIAHGLVSIMPPGFPALLAFAGLLHVEFWVNPLLGALGTWLLYDAIARRCGHAIALGFAALWAASPIVVWGSTQLMSDLPAATFCLLTFVLAERGRSKLAGAALGFSFWIRPTNVLFVPALLLLRPEKAHFRRLAAGMTLTLVCWGAFAIGRYGRPFPPAYSGNVHEFSTEFVARQLGFFGRTTLTMFGLVVPLSVFQILRRPRQSVAFVIWLLGYVGLYAWWKYPFIDWWWTRYLLPAYPALFVLAAEGTVALFEWVERKGLPTMAIASIGTAAVLLSCGRALMFDETHHLFLQGFEKTYFEDSRLVADLVPRDSLVGAVNYTGPLRMYAGLESFDYDEPSAKDLITWAMGAKRPVYTVIEPEEYESSPNVLDFRERFEIEEVARLSGWGGRAVLRRVRPRAGGDQGLELIFGTPAARTFLREGWSGDEVDGGESFVWSDGASSTLEVPLDAAHDVRMTLLLAPFVVPGRRQRVGIVVNDTSVASIDLAEDPETRVVQLPSRVIREKNRVELRYAYAVSPKELGRSADERQLAVVVKRIAFRPVEGPP
jgi:hypothetical protein